MPTNTYGETDTLMHNLTESGASVSIWTTWTNLRQARHLDGSLCPTLKMLPYPKHQTIKWFLAHGVFYVVKTVRTLPALDCVDLIIRTRWRIYQSSARLKTFGNE
jgi:hypothetical protein